MLNSVVGKPVVNDINEFHTLVFRLQIDTAAVVPYTHVEHALTSVLHHVFEMTLQLNAECIHVVLHSFLQKQGQIGSKGRSPRTLGTGHLLTGIGILASEHIGHLLLGTHCGHIPRHLQKDVGFCRTTEAVERTFRHCGTGGLTLNQTVLSGKRRDILDGLRHILKRETALRHQSAYLCGDCNQIHVIGKGGLVVGHRLAYTLIVESLNISVLIAPHIAGHHHQCGFLCLGKGRCSCQQQHQ